MAETHAEPEHMSDFEALMWTLEQNPALSNTFANVTILDQPPDRSHLVAKMQVAISKVPKLHQRPEEPPNRQGTPVWADDPGFDLAHHLRWVNLGGDATERDLYDYVAMLAAQPFDRERPLWDFTVVEGLLEGKAAMVQRMHHTITDGEGGIRLSVAFLDLEREPQTEPDSGAPVAPDGAAGSTTAQPDPQPRAVGDFLGSLGDSVRRRGMQVVDAIGVAGSFLRNPGDAAELARSTGRQAQAMTRCSPLWTERSLQRWFGTTSLDLAEVREAAGALGGTVNDFFVTGAADAAGRVHAAHGSPVGELRISMPVSIRDSRPEGRGDPMAGGNAFALAQVMVPTGSELTVAERFSETHERLGASRQDRALNALGNAAAVINLLPTAALLATGERATAGIDFACSNVRAAPFDLYMGGALLEANYPVGPLAGTAFNLTTMSYRGMLWLGLHVDTAAVEDPRELLGAIDASYTALFAAA
ncbi:MAG: wax ester/triacylglycerol synthase domain-containing protein [Microthrixaceae bacterium]